MQTPFGQGLEGVCCNLLSILVFCLGKAWCEPALQRALTTQKERLMWCEGLEGLGVFCQSETAAWFSPFAVIH